MSFNTLKNWIKFQIFFLAGRAARRTFFPRKVRLNCQKLVWDVLSPSVGVWPVGQTYFCFSNLPAVLLWSKIFQAGGKVRLVPLDSTYVWKAMKLMLSKLWSMVSKLWTFWGDGFESYETFGGVVWKDMNFLEGWFGKIWSMVSKLWTFRGGTVVPSCHSD